MERFKEYLVYFRSFKVCWIILSLTLVASRLPTHWFVVQPDEVPGSCTGWHHGRIASDWCGVFGTFSPPDLLIVGLVVP